MRAQQNSLALSIWGIFRCCDDIRTMPSLFLQSSGLFVDSAFPHATAAEKAEAEADDVQLFHSPDQTGLEGPGSALTIAGGKQATSKTSDLSRTYCHVQANTFHATMPADRLPCKHSP